MMSQDDLNRWEERHRSVTHGDGPSPFLVEQIARVPRGGKALDVAAGQGRNSFFLARQGFLVEAMEIAPSAVIHMNRLARELGLPVKAIEQDLDRVELSENRYDLIIDFNYLNRDLIPKLKAALSPGGFIIFETYLVDQREIGHPKNPAYLLEHNELLEIFRDFRVLFYREGLFAERGEDRFVASLFGQKEERRGGSRT